MAKQCRSTEFGKRGGIKCNRVAGHKGWHWRDSCDPVPCWPNRRYPNAKPPKSVEEQPHERTPELRAVIDRAYHQNNGGSTLAALEQVAREVVEIVARKSAEIADQAISQDAGGYASTAILTHWGLK